MHKQEEGKSLDGFMTDLNALAEHCSYLQDEIIHDYLVAGLNSAGLPEKLQLDEDLTLKKEIMLICQSEEMKLQQALLQGAAILGARMIPNSTFSHIKGPTLQRTFRWPSQNDQDSLWNQVIQQGLESLSKPRSPFLYC